MKLSLNIERERERGREGGREGERERELFQASEAMGLSAWFCSMCFFLVLPFQPSSFSCTCSYLASIKLGAPVHSSQILVLKPHCLYSTMFYWCLFILQFLHVVVAS